jgi:hypothetical protein
MELFAAAGIELPSLGGGRRRQTSVRSLRIPLLSHKVVQQARELAAFAPTPEQLKIATEYAKKVRNEKFLKQKETAVRPIFVDEVFKQLLGYTNFHIENDYTLVFEESIRRGSVDVAIGHFNSVSAKNEIVAPFELKGPDTDDLDRIMPGRGRSPVQQAWDYAIDAPGSRWVLVSNCVEIRLYGFGRGRDAYELFDLSRLDEHEEFARLWLVLSASRFLGGLTDKLLRDTDDAYKDVTNVLYKDYKNLRDRLIAFLVDSSDGPRLASLQAIEVAQKTLDRILFIAFAERTDLLPEKLLERASKAGNDFIPQPLWKNFLSLFRAVDKGSDRLLIPGYNGGLFAQDDVADELILPDELAKDVAKLGQWDYKREVPVTVLGHIFEQSITDLEKLKAESRGEAPPDVSKRKRDGVVYTPDMVTRFLVEQTIVRTLDERLARLKAVHDMATQEGEKALWKAYLTDLRSLTIVDPACGSGAFLVAAFDELARQYRSVTERLKEMGETIDFDIFDEIVTKNLFGVDLNAESVEITRLALWLKTARRHHKLQNLEDTIKVGNSLIEDKAYTPRPFNWRKAFPQVFKNKGFDVVLGNPPYVRMEFLKEQKPYLEKQYVVAADRSDLYAYFFEKGVQLLKADGRLGYISSSTFFRTGSGANLRTFLTDGVAVETVVDFGDLQLFEGVTTYPAIITAQKGKINSALPDAADAAPQGEDAASADNLSFLLVKDALPENLGRLFAASAQPMLLSRLTSGSWRFESEELARMRDKITLGRKTLGEVYGAPLYGIKTGLNEAFIIDTPTRDRLVKRDPKSADLLKPFLRGENIKRWRVESDGLFLINTPKGKVDIEQYPAVRDWLLPFRPELEKRATQQEWWELQQAQLAYQPLMDSRAIVFPDLSQGPKFGICDSTAFFDCTLFFMDNSDPVLVTLLNSKVSWSFLFSISNPMRGGIWRVRLKSQYVEQLPIPDMPPAARTRLANLGEACTTAARERHAVQSAVQHRLLDLAGSDRRKLTGKLEEWHTLDFKAFMAEIKKAFRAEIPLKQRGEWEAYLAENRAAVLKLSETIAAAERDIDHIVYGLFDLTPDEIALLEASLEGQY